MLSIYAYLVVKSEFVLFFLNTLHRVLRETIHFFKIFGQPIRSRHPLKLNFWLPLNSRGAEVNKTCCVFQVFLPFFFFIRNEDHRSFLIARPRCRRCMSSPSSGDLPLSETISIANFSLNRRRSKLSPRLRVSAPTASVSGPPP